MRRITCHYCHRDAELVQGHEIYPHREDLHHLYFWLCGPCNAYVGCHRKGATIGRGKQSDGTVPLGRLADAELRKAKSAAHYAFDPLWRSGGMSRSKAYAWLAHQLGISVQNCHIGMFDVAGCRAVVCAVQQKGALHVEQ